MRDEPLDHEAIKTGMARAPFPALRSLVCLLLAKITSVEGLTVQEGVILELALQETLARLSQAETT